MTGKVKDLRCERLGKCGKCSGQRAVESSVMDAVDLYIRFGSL